MDGKFYQLVNEPKDENQAADIAINVSVSRNPTYSGDISYNDKHKIRNYWKSLLLDFYDKNKQVKISREVFFDYVNIIKRKMNSKYSSAFKCNTNGYDNGFRLAHAQKSLSVFLKHLWCMGKMGEPPFCPIDGIILNNVLKKKKAWTKLNDTNTYETYIRYIDSAVGTTMSVAEWEYICWNNVVEKRNSKVTSGKNLSPKQDVSSDPQKDNARDTKQKMKNHVSFSRIKENDISGIFHDELLIGYKIPIDNKTYKLFVCHKDGPTGYFCELRYCDDENTDIMNIDSVKKLVEKNGGVKVWTHNQGRPKPTFKYRSFGNDKHSALSLMQKILEDVNAPQDVMEEIKKLIDKCR